MSMSVFPGKSLSLFLILCLSFNGCAGMRAQRALEKATAVRFFTEEEIVEGENIHKQMIGEFYIYTEQQVAEYVNEIGQNLTGVPPKGRQPYHFTILYNDQIYATSAVGGFIYVTTGMINFLDNEAELAGVLAKEIGGLQYKDPRLDHDSGLKRGVTNAVAIAFPFLGPFGMLAAAGVIVWDIASDPKEVSESSQALTADAKAMHYMVRAGYDPQGFIDIMYKFLQADREVRPYFHNYYVSHPITQSRIDAVMENFKELPLENRTFNVNRERYLEMTKGIREIYKV